MEKLLILDLKQELKVKDRFSDTDKVHRPVSISSSLANGTIPNNVEESRKSSVDSYARGK